jgi:hypothetical protein
MQRSRFFHTLLAFSLLTGTSFAASSIWKLGDPGRAWRADDGGVQFVQEAAVNDAPGDPMSPVTDQLADDDYYFAGNYGGTIGTVAMDEAAVERAFAGADNNLRFHFNLDAGSYDNDTLAVFSVNPFNIHDVGATSRYGVQISFNGNEILPETIVGIADLNNVITTAPFTLGSVGAIFGDGGDNVLQVSGVNFDADGGGNWMGMDYHELQTADATIPEPSSASLIMAGLLFLLPCFRRRARK